jgi:ubiquinone/menaquinone biosynthesis C-methylase UbiE
VFRVNLGGEGEVPGVLNQQPPFALGPTWFSWRNGGKTLRELAAAGMPFVIADNTKLPFADNSVDEVFTNSVPLDRNTKDGPGVQSSEIRRILKPGGVWFKNGAVEFIKP